MHEDKRIYNGTLSKKLHVSEINSNSFGMVTKEYFNNSTNVVVITEKIKRAFDAPIADAGNLAGSQTLDVRT